jgi:hypothetical protein
LRWISPPMKTRPRPCLACDRTGWLRRQIPHPYTAEHMPVTVTRACPFCAGQGDVSPKEPHANPNSRS